MNNILSAIRSVIENSSIELEDIQGNISNRANQMGAAFEDYVKNAFSDCLGMPKRTVITARQNAFSYLGNNRNPPDAMLKGGDAIEIKKIETLGISQIQLNSSYPKNKLFSNNPKLSKQCRNCEVWDVKDLIYVIGHVDKQKLHNIFFVYGDLYCDSPEIYQQIENLIKCSFNALDDVEFAETNELGRLNKVDHLGISDLRVRGMWLIKSPFQQFRYLTEDIDDYIFKLVALIPEEKFNSFKNRKEFTDFCKEKGANISDENIENPKNPANFIKSKLITYFY